MSGLQRTRARIGRGLVSALLCALLWASAALALAACGPTGNGGEREVRGQVTAVDAAASTFTVRGADGRDYRFKLVEGSKADLPEIKTHFDRKQPVEVRYRGTTEPYEVISAH